MDSENSEGRLSMETRLKALLKDARRIADEAFAANSGWCCYMVSAMECIKHALDEKMTNNEELCSYDADGKKVVAGDWVEFGYGIPRVGVTAQVGEKDGKLFVFCHGHNPDKCELGLLALHVGDWYKVDAPIKGSLRHVR